MNGVHDMGGMQGFGPIIREDNEPVFHEDWERKTRAMVICLSRNKVINLDEVRYANERVTHDHHLAFSYYERWLYGFLILLIEKGVLCEDEVQAVKIAFGIEETQDFLGVLTQLKYLPPKENTQELVRPTLETLPKFKPGDKVKTKLINSKGHIRLPGYAKGRFGLVKEIHGNYRLPETNVYSAQPIIQPVYSVEFKTSDLWGTDVPEKDKILIDLWESYLEPANV